MVKSEFHCSDSADKHGLQNLPSFIPARSGRWCRDAMQTYLPGNSCSDAVRWHSSQPVQHLVLMKCMNWSSSLEKTPVMPIAACWSSSWRLGCSKLLFMSSCANSIAVDRLPEAHLQLQIMTVDFNQRCLKTPKFVQCIQSSTRGINTLDCAYLQSNQCLSTIFHCLCSSQEVRTWPERSLSQLQVGFTHTQRVFSVLLSSLFHVDTVCTHTSNSCTFLAETEQTLSTFLRDRCNTSRPL